MADTLLELDVVVMLEGERSKVLQAAASGERRLIHSALPFVFSVYKVCPSRA